MAFFELTNRAGKHAGNKILLNTHWITSVYEDSETPGGSLSTFIYSVPQNKTWIVEESYWEVRKILFALESKACTCK